MFSTKPKSLSLTQSAKYSFVASFDKISSNNIKISLLKFFNFLGVAKPPEQICMVSRKKVDLVRKKYGMLLNISLVLKLRNFAFQRYITLNSLG